MLSFSPLDSSRFGCQVFRGSIEKVDDRALLSAIIEGNVDIAILRVPSGTGRGLQRLGRYGMPPIHADTLVYYHLALDKYTPTMLRNADLEFATARPSDRDEIMKLVLATFDGYVSHYHANPQLKSGDILDGYAEWAAGYIDSESSQRTTWVVRSAGTIVAFACCSSDASSNTAEGVLYGVHPAYSGRGLYGDLIRHTQAEYKKLGFASMEVSTQIWNLAVQKVWAREGFVLRESFDTYHVNAMLSSGLLMIDKTLTFDAEQVLQFSAVTGDRNPVHLDSEAAKRAGFSGKITHGMLAGSELSRIFGTEIPGPGTLFLRSDLMFLKPVYPDIDHNLQIRYLSELPLSGHVRAVATIRDPEQDLCMLCYSDLLIRN